MDVTFSTFLGQIVSNPVLAVTVILALGQRADTDFLHAIPGMSFHDDVVDVDPHSLMTAVPGIFAGGDAVPSDRTVTRSCTTRRSRWKA